MSVSTREQIVAQLRRGQHTVEELAAAVGVTDNSVRAHLAALERDGFVQVEALRRTPGAGKPAALYGLRVAADVAASSAYPPVLVAVVEVLLETLPDRDASALLEAVGHRLARTAGGRASGNDEQRVEAAASALVALGGDVEVGRDGEKLVIQGFGCPLASAVSSRPEMCHAVQVFVADVAGAVTHQHCHHGERPRCRFIVERTSDLGHPSSTTP